MAADQRVLEVCQAIPGDELIYMRVIFSIVGKNLFPPSEAYNNISHIFKRDTRISAKGILGTTFRTTLEYQPHFRSGPKFTS